MSRLSIALLMFCLLGAAMAVEVTFNTNAQVSVNGEAFVQADLDKAGLSVRVMTSTATTNGIIAYSIHAQADSEGATVDIEIDTASQTSNGPITVNSHFDTTVLAPTGLSFNADSSVNYIASFPYAIVEVDPNGVDVAVHKVRDFLWSMTNDLTVRAANAASLAAKAFVGTTLQGSNTVSLSFSVQTAAEVGVSSFKDQYLIPKTWGFILELSGYTLQNANNSLRIIYAVATGDASIQTTGQLTVTNPNPEFQAYADLASTAVFNGNGLAVNVDAFAQANIDVNSLFPTINTQLVGKYGTNHKVYTANVTFEAGSNGFVYGGRSGTGYRLNEVKRNTNDASSLSFSAAFIVFALAVLGLFC